MKKKRILIAYFANGDMRNVIESEAMWNHIMKEFSGLNIFREVNLPNTMRMVEFEDGTSVEMRPIHSVRGFRATHVYFSKSIQVDGEMYSVVMSSLMARNDESIKFETEGLERSERFKVFSIKDGNLIVEKG